MNGKTCATVFSVCLLALTACGQSGAAEEHSPASAREIDERSLRLGGIGSFAEVVSLGIKRMALSAAMSPKDMDDLIDEATRTAKQHKVELYRETDFLVTDLFPASATQGKHVLLIYQGSTRDAYLALKEQKSALLKSNSYSGKAREEVARKLGRLLSYPEAKIDELLKATTK